VRGERGEEGGRERFREKEVGGRREGERGSARDKGWGGRKEMRLNFSRGC